MKDGHLLITGCDSSLGKELVKQSPCRLYGIENRFMETKELIESQIIRAIDIEGKITHVINNYGINHLSWIGTTPPWDGAIMNANIMSTYWVIDNLVRHNQTCRVINVASATYRVPQRCTSLYAASKAAVVQMTKVMARELASQGWVINAVAPGKIEDTRMSDMVDQQVIELRGWTKEFSDEYAVNIIPMRRYTNTKEVTEVIYKLFEMPDYVNGAVLDVMGGV